MKVHIAAAWGNAFKRNPATVHVHQVAKRLLFSIAGASGLPGLTSTFVADICSNRSMLQLSPQNLEKTNGRY